MLDVSLRPWLSPEIVTAPAPERDRVDVKWWDSACYAAVEPLQRVLIRRQLLQSGLVALVEAHQPELDRLDDAGLRAAADRLRPQLVAKGFALELVARSFALIRETAARKIAMRHRPVQLLGGFAMISGHVAEMRTGEGKTITALLPAATAALAGMPVHVVTINDYLAERDANELRPVYEALGLEVGLAVHGQPRPERRRAYYSDVLYACNKELVFDYLRDRHAIGRPSAARLRASCLGLPADNSQTLMRGLHFAIVDEADSILIDEARTPLIISREHEAEMSTALCNAILQAARKLSPVVHYGVSEVRRSVRLTPEGQAALPGLLSSLEGHWKAKRAREELVQQALAALLLYRRDQHYIVADQKIQIVDEFTGRTMPDRQWQRGLQQLIEAKENCPTTGRRETLTQITYQRFFRRYLGLCGMTGTGAEVAAEFRSVYGLSVIPIATHKPDLKRDLGVALYSARSEKWRAVVEASRILVDQNRSVLIGTRSVEASEQLAGFFAQGGLAHVVLNARNEPEEAELVALAGQRGRITIATNMAGRGTDIKLAPDVALNGGLHVILTEYHESGRIDRQLFGRCGRQGDPGSYQAIVSLEDNLFEVHAGFLTRRCLRAPGLDQGLPPWLGRILKRVAQAKAERLHARIRNATLRADKDMERALAFARQTKA
ncbi:MULTISPECIES: DEAD/DEAH box helicase [unclassified Bradyrhizobium]|uniref:preprotein translocase subunit SecA n=1 Tax=unclassified Bradyrhizobium TaxID=2631580 RepID=UPI001FFAA600|nr:MULTISPECIES: DEAD/DEAH box helicase [unclassified Bradyrhizobium]